MSPLQAAIYARVSSERQAETHTIASQLAALRARVAQDGLALSEEVQFIDEGYSGATLVRPALERVRDLAAAGALDRLYVHSPDRLARKYAYQVLLLDELHRAGVEVVFLNRELGRTPEDDLLLQVQGMMAEYERAKIIERHRRGKLHRARAGSVNVLGGAPYGYRYITKVAGGGQARYEIVADEAHVVRQVFEWVGVHRLSIGAVCRRLNHAGERTCTGKTTWDRSVVWGDAQESRLHGAGGLRQDARGAAPSPVAAAARAAGCPTACYRPGGRTAGGVDLDRGAPASRRRRVRRRPGPVAGKPRPRPAAVAGREIPPAGLDLLQAVWLRILWKGHQLQGRQRPP